VQLAALALVGAGIAAYSVPAALVVMGAAVLYAIERMA